jgi:hypothetical protein
MTIDPNDNVAIQNFTADTEKMLMPIGTEVHIVTADDYEDAAATLQRIKGRSKELDDLRRSLTRPIDETKRRIMALFERPMSLLVNAEAAIKRGILGYQREQERLRSEEEARLREQARKEQERLLARSARAEAAGKEEMAEALEDQAAMIIAPIVVSDTPRISGLSTRQTWHAEVVDKMALIQAVAAGHVPDVVLVPDMTILNAQARALKTALDYPGVRAVPEQVVAAGGARDLAPPRPRS